MDEFLLKVVFIFRKNTGNRMHVKTLYLIMPYDN